MVPRAEDIDALRIRIRHLKYAIATTSCRETAGVLQQMLSQAEAKASMSAGQILDVDVAYGWVVERMGSTSRS